MSSNLEGFHIQLAFDANGDVTKVSYHDPLGCVLSAKEFELTQTLDDVIQLHLSHYRYAHRSTCSSMIETTEGIVLRCTLKRHGLDDEHVFKL